MVDSEDEEYDYLAASMTSQKTVCSDAFDFLFDSENLNPDTIQVWVKKTVLFPGYWSIDF